jgi:glycosyltransferase involved in cell wall biosynthesis
MPSLSIVIPVYCGARTIGPLVQEVREKLSGHQLELVLVNDGSPDDSESVCEEIAATTPGVVFVSLRRNSSEHNAVMCGLNHATGDYAIIIDDDFQNPPSEIIKLVEEAERGGYDVVYSYYSRKHHSLFRNWGSSLHNWMATYLLGKPHHLYLSSFKLIRREVVQEIIKYRGPFPYVDGLLLRVTGNIGKVLVQHESRRDGKSTYTLSKLVALWLNMFLNFSVKPLRVFTFLGAGMLLISVLLSAWFIVEKILRPETAIGWTSTMVAILFFSGFQTMMLGLMGEYLGKAYLDISGTPQWVIKKVVRHSDHTGKSQE